jgi:coenzyme F420-reducing hydrogenase beta subunit
MSTMLKKLFRRKKKIYPNRFLKHYYSNQKKVLKERKSKYDNKRKKGICVRCDRQAIKGIVLCEYHKKQRDKYNKKARNG